MFSYRHGFHAGNHADVLKHSVLIAILKYLLQKPVPIMVVDTHAGAGIYDLNDVFAQTSGESLHGIVRLRQTTEPSAQLLLDYLELINSFGATAYPGSPLIIQRFLRETDKLKLFELHPTEVPLLEKNMAQLRVGRQVSVLVKDGFAGVKQFLPPPSRRALVLCDPSYELKTDYAEVLAMLEDSLKRFATGTYCIWYPLIERPETAHFAKHLCNIASDAGRSWLHAQLMVKSSAPTQAKQGLPGSAVFIVNPPYTLGANLAQALPQLVNALAQDAGAAYDIQVG